MTPPATPATPVTPATPAVAAVSVDVPAHLHPAYDTGVRRLLVTGLVPLTEQVLHIVLARPDGGVLAAFQPGSHLVVTAGERRNAYSLVGDGVNPREYAISVMRRGDGGGSDWLHDHLTVGDHLEIEGPRSMFAPVREQRHALLVAGGIGVTPIVSHARAIARAGGTAEVLYSYRPGHAAHLDDLRRLAERPGIVLHEATTVEDTVALLRERFADQPVGTHAYACGPAALLETYETSAAEAGWPAARVHLERFTAPEQDPGSPFTVTLGVSGDRLEVPAGVSLLQRLLDHGIAAPNLCRQGVCGECRVPVRRARSLDHRDFVLSDDERSAGDALMACVSRGEDIEVDL